MTTESLSFAGSVNTAGKPLLAWSGSETKSAENRSRNGSPRRPSEYLFHVVHTSSLPLQCLPHSRGKLRFSRLRRDQQRGQRVEHDIQDGPSWRILLQRHRRLIIPRRHLYRVRVRFASTSLAVTCFLKFHHSFVIDSDGSLAVTVGAHEAIAVHTGALGSGSSEPKTAERVPVLFNVNATTTFGEVGFLPPEGFDVDQ